MVSNILTFIIFIPLFFVVLLLLYPIRQKQIFKWIYFSSALLQCILSIYLFYRYQEHTHTLSSHWALNRFSFVEKYDWIDVSLGGLGFLSIDYFIGVDGLSVSMVLLSSVVMLVAGISSWKVDKNVRGYFILLLLLASAIPGCFAALDLFLFYLFFELMLLPMYFLIGLWGGPRREYASIKFFLYTLLGSLFILVVIIALQLSVIDPVQTALHLGLIDSGTEAGGETLKVVHHLLAEGKIPRVDQVHTFNILYMTDAGNFLPGSILNALQPFYILGENARYIAFLFLVAGFLIKLPSFPFHTWLPDAHVEAPTPISVILAGILLKIGGYGILRLAYGIFPEGAIKYGFFLGILGMISILYAAFIALAVGDLKKMIAYSSISHMGYVLLGIASLTPEGLNGAIFQMFSHGIISSALFLIAGVIYDRTHDRTIDYYRGLASKMPAFTTVVTIAFFASLGLPGFSGFIGELFVLLGAFNSTDMNGLIPRWVCVLSTLGLLLGAGYYLWTLQKMFFGKFSLSAHLKINSTLQDLDRREKLLFVPLIALTILFGIFPNLLFDKIAVSASDFAIYVFQTGKLYLK